MKECVTISGDLCNKLKGISVTSWDDLLMEGASVTILDDQVLNGIFCPHVR